MFSKKIVATLAFTIASISTINASPAPAYTYNPTRYQKIARYWEEKVRKYAVSASVACGVVAGGAYFTTTQNNYSCLTSKVVDTAAVSLLASLTSLLSWGIADFVIYEAAD